MVRLRASLLPLLTLAAIVTLYLPWGWHQNASLSPNVRDLAEWTTLAPQSLAQNPPLSSSLYLRGSIALLAMLVALSIVRHERDPHASRGLILFSLLAALGLALTLFPPLDFLSDPGNLNYRQQLLAALGALLGITVLVVIGRRLPARLRNGLGLVGALGAGLLAILGLILAQQMFTTLGVTLSIGGGALGFVGLQCALAGVYSWQLWARAQPT